MVPLLCCPDSVKLVCKQVVVSRGICADVTIEEDRTTLEEMLVLLL